MKNFKTFMSESGINTSHHDLAIDKNTNMAVFSDPTVIKKLNAWVGSIAGSYVLPEDAIHNLRSSLTKIGLSFDAVPSIAEDSGSFEMPLTLFGGRFGKLPETPHDEFVSDDGISNQVEGGLSLVIGYEKNEDNSCRLSANIK